MAAPLLVFDFDGVIVDGMGEYWWAARQSVLELAPGACPPEPIPEGFELLRPLIHKGWEMVLIAAELSRPDPGAALAALLDSYDATLPRALARWGWNPELLQTTLERIRRVSIAADRAGWLAMHRFYPGVPRRLQALAAEGADWLVLTTKGGDFARELLSSGALDPLAVYGHEQGSKPEVLRRLVDDGRELWFVEDRRPTLELVSTTPGLERVRCFLASWGYLGPGDRDHLPTGIRLLEPQRFEAPLADWI
ncbi:MAG: HAD family hydrolase [Cyanobacteriota bacterium]|jgi:phosphoglycolate phosphatase-like HAD superfamily hydrolase|nr:HAD family hydrolase [Cyanobacteriota bacterium]